tara:strand:+ start:84 stop:335 length:252 start_codon:yes stop_codon:yes gene_type:complete
MKILNTNEQIVLKAIVSSADDYVGGDFSYLEWVMEYMPNTLKLNQVKGYLSSLQTKNYIACCEDGQICTGSVYDYNFNLTMEA